jgi:hypothetical protein
MADEGGVWRTIGGRRVFIKDGQSLTDAMRESGKFGSSKKKLTTTAKKQTVDAEASAEYGVEHRVWGKATGTSYEALKDDQYKLTGEKTGETLQIPKNESGEFEVCKAPKTNGFLNGKYVADENVNAILSDGRIVLRDHDFNNDTYYKISGIIEAETLRLAGYQKEGQFYRGTDNPKEIEYLKNGTMRVSTNHMTGEKEDGVSVWESPKYPFKYQYRVTGKVSGVGSDGEPLLDPASIKLVSAKSYSVKDYNAAMEKGKPLFCKAYGWTEEQYDAAKKGSIKNRKRL